MTNGMPYKTVNVPPTVMNINGREESIYVAVDADGIIKDWCEHIRSLILRIRFRDTPWMHADEIRPISVLSTEDVIGKKIDDVDTRMLRLKEVYSICTALIGEEQDMDKEIGLLFNSDEGKWSSYNSKDSHKHYNSFDEALSALVPLEDAQ